MLKKKKTKNNIFSKELSRYIYVFCMKNNIYSIDAKCYDCQQCDNQAGKHCEDDSNLYVGITLENYNKLKSNELIKNSGVLKLLFTSFSDTAKVYYEVLSILDFDETKYEFLEDSFPSKDDINKKI